VLPPFLRLAQLAGLNAVPAVGVFFGGWSSATALWVYWGENVIGGALVALRIALHRRWTHAKGHERTHLGLRVSGSLRIAGRSRPLDLAPQSLFAEFVWSVALFSAGHALLLVLLVGGVLGLEPAQAALREGWLGVAIFQLAGFALDLPGLAGRPFAWVKGLAERSVGRVILVHLALLGGVVASAGRAHPERFLLVFAGLKLASDVASWLPLARAAPDPGRPPRLASWIGARGSRSGRTFTEAWSQRAEQERRLAAEDEERLPG
jgi:Family of unknown function (DUF6498)